VNNATNLIAGLLPLDDEATDAPSLLMLYTLVGYLQPKHIVEAGTYLAHFAVGAARVMPRSCVETWDIIDHQWDKTLASNVVFHHADFNPPSGFDFALVDSGPAFDGSHLYIDDTVRIRHWRLACERVSPGGVVVCHDTNTTDWVGAADINAQGTQLTGGRGLTLWRKPL
jgi:predicted O-methyltransferase YrrM